MYQYVCVWCFFSRLALNRGSKHLCLATCFTNFVRGALSPLGVVRCWKDIISFDLSPCFRFQVLDGFWQWIWFCDSATANLAEICSKLTPEASVTWCFVSDSSSSQMPLLHGFLQVLTSCFSTAQWRHTECLGSTQMNIKIDTKSHLISSNFLAVCLIIQHMLLVTSLVSDHLKSMNPLLQLFHARFHKIAKHSWVEYVVVYHTLQISSGIAAALVVILVCNVNRCQPGTQSWKSYSSPQSMLDDAGCSSPKALKDRARRLQCSLIIVAWATLAMGCRWWIEWIELHEMKLKTYVHELEG